MADQMKPNKALQSDAPALGVTDMTQVHYPVWRALGIAMLLFVVPSFLGFLAAFLIQEHGSVIFLVIGFWIGILASAIYLGAYLVRRHAGRHA
jgi:hypothetical protein